jgi:hypothetical protein
MLLNTTNLVDRYGRPSVGSKVAIRTQFLNNGAYFDPYDVSACTIFQRLANASPSSVLEPSSQIVKTGLSMAPTGVVMNFGISGDPVGGNGHDGGQTGLNAPRVTSNNLEDAAYFPNYVPGTQASGIYRISAGDYVAVLDGEVDLSGGFNLNYPFQKGEEVQNSASAVTEYIDVWTVKLFATSEYQVFINNFTLYNDTFITLTEPLLLTTSNRLSTKHLNVGTQATMQDLVITTEITVDNRNLTESVRNIIQDYGIQNPQIVINRVVDGTAVPTSVPFTTENANIRVTGDNTIIYPFGGAGSTVTPGTYVVEVYYDFLTQKIKSQPMYFMVS